MNKMTNSHILVHGFDYFQPASVEEAISLLNKLGDGIRVLAGGTDLLVQMKIERHSPKALVHLQNLPELRGIVFEDDRVWIGACTSIWAIRHDPGIQRHYPALAEACASFSSSQIQFMGTIGGNLCNGSPASDAAPALIALSAQAVIKGPDGSRQLPLEEFFVGPGKTALRRGELLVELVVPRPQSGAGSAFAKVTRVKADLAKANAGIALVRDGDRVVSCRLAFGSVAPKPIRAAQAEAVLAGKVFSAELVDKAADVASQEIAPIDDVRSTASYRREAVRAMTHDILNVAWQQAGEERPASFGGNASSTQSHGQGAASAASGLQVLSTEKHPIALVVNGARYELAVAPNDLLLNVLREELELTGSKYGCGIGECAACTVQMDGHPVLSCLVLAVAAHEHEIITVEGLQGPDGELDPLQAAFIEHAAFQCGYCTPGMLMTAKTLLDESVCPSEEQVRDYMKGNLCRCTGYASIMRAVMSCVQEPGASG